MLRAGARRSLHFDPKSVAAAIVTSCAGIIGLEVHELVVVRI